MADNPSSAGPALHNSATSSANEALRRVQQIRKDGFENIRVYRETQEIDEMTLRLEAKQEADR